MTIKVIWEEKDIVSGVRIAVKGVEERFILGYRHSSTSKKDRVMISLVDGMVSKDYTKIELMEVLNNNGWIPEKILDNL